ncbi:hypothetical protein CLBKND_02719 [Methylorubrum aminovorans]
MSGLESGTQNDLPPRLDVGPFSPLGACALSLDQNRKDTLYRVHGTNEPETIGQADFSGCPRMLNEDVMDLCDRVPVGRRSWCDEESLTFDRQDFRKAQS